MFSYNLAKILSIIVLGIGITVLIGWFSDIDILKSLSPNWVTMKFSTAMCFVMGGMILYFMNESERENSDYSKIILLTPMIIILFFTVTFLISTLANIPTGIQDIFIKEKTNAIKSVSSGIPSIGTMINFLLIYIAGLISLLNSTKKKKIFSLIGIAITSIGSLAVLGYIINFEVLYYTVEGLSTAMALHTAISFVIIGTGILFLSKERQSTDIISSYRISIKAKVLLVILPGTLATLI